MVFYYDETFHDKKITQNKNGFLNGYSKNSNDSFIYALVGFDEASNLIEKYNELESRIKLSLQLDKELKSTIFDKDNFEYGLKSMRRQCKDFYYEFLNLLIDSNFVFQVGMISKTEYVLRQLLQNINIYVPIIEESFVYSLTKFIERHRLTYLFNEAFVDSNNNIQVFLNKLKELLEKVYIVIKDIPREELEAKAIKDHLYILNHSSIKSNKIITTEWNYDIIADGVYKRLTELDSINANIFVDNEQKTYEAFKAKGLNAIQQDSIKSLGVRITDMFVGFVGKTVRALKDKLSDPELYTLSDIKKELYEERRLLSKEWFDIDQQTFDLYKKIGYYFMNNASYWSTFTLSYFDDAIIFFWFFDYFDTYKCYNHYSNYMKKHIEKFNAYCCGNLQLRYKEIADRVAKSI